MNADGNLVPAHGHITFGRANPGIALNTMSSGVHPGSQSLNNFGRRRGTLPSGLSQRRQQGVFDYQQGHQSGFGSGRGQQHFFSQGQQQGRQNTHGSNLSATQAAGKTRLGGKPFPEVNGIPIDSPGFFHRNAGPRGAGAPPPMHHGTGGQRRSFVRNSGRGDGRNDRQDQKSRFEDGRQGRGGENPLDGWGDRSRNWAVPKVRRGPTGPVTEYT
jgi:hypothetical protein